jgi:predicted dehydrogenase
MLKAKDLDIAIIGTPDHWHALTMIAAVEAGCDVYVEKPISVDIAEGKAMVEAARKNKRVVQVGTQRRSTPHINDAKELIKSGALGRIGLVETCCYYHMRANANVPNIPPPETLNFDMYTGPAPLRPYNQLIHPRGWRSFREYGNGIMGDMCIHMLDTARYLMETVKWPKRVQSSGGIYVQSASRANIPDTQTATFDYGDLVIKWDMRTYGHAPDPQYPWAAIFYGDKGTLKLSVNSYTFQPHGSGEAVSKKAVRQSDKFPTDLTEESAEPDVAAGSRAHLKNFLECVVSRGTPVADIEEGHISTATCILGNMSLDLGVSLTWDADNQTISGNEMAAGKLARPYRQPWIHPGDTL